MPAWTLAMAAAPGNGAYTASKYAVRAIGQTLARGARPSGSSSTSCSMSGCP